MPRDPLRLLPRPWLRLRPTGEPVWGHRWARESGQLPACRSSGREGRFFPSHPNNPTPALASPGRFHHALNPGLQRRKVAH